MDSDGIICLICRLKIEENEEHLNGRVSFDSSKKEGTTFRIILQLQEK